MRCPGQDTRYWNGEDIFDVQCPMCGATVEFFKDESKRRCPQCRFLLRNPRLDLGCAEWCPYGPQCLEMGGLPPDVEPPPHGPEGGPKDT